jgi:hypothetical protein
MVLDRRDTGGCYGTGGIKRDVTGQEGWFWTGERDSVDVTGY